MLKKLLPLLAVLLSLTAKSQVVYKIKTDTLKVTNDSCTAEFVLENSTKNVGGFLFNKGNGRTSFVKALQKLSDTTYRIGADTLLIKAATSGMPLSSLQNAIATNTIQNAGYAQEWQWNSLGGTKGLSITSNTTLAGSHDAQRLLNVELRGANTNPNLFTAAGYFRNTHTGTNSTNRGLTVIADSATFNIGVYAYTPPASGNYSGYFYGGDVFANHVRLGVNANNNATITGELNGLLITTTNNNELRLAAGTNYVSAIERFKVASSNSAAEYLRVQPTLLQTTTNYMDLNFGVNNAVSITIKAPDGNVGVGTTSPAEKLSVSGNLALATAGNKLKIATGSNASIGTATLSSGTVTISTSAVSSSSIIFVNYNTPSGTLGSGLSTPVGSIVNGSSFVIRSLTSAGAVNTSDNSTVNWWIVN